MNERSAPAKLQLFVFENEDYVAHQTFRPGNVVIGRRSDADLILADDSIELAHAVISFDGVQAILLDLSKRGVTKVNRDFVTRRVVEPRDEIQIGRYVVKIRVVVPSPSERLGRIQLHRVLHLSPIMSADHDVNRRCEPTARPTAPGFQRRGRRLYQGDDDA